MIMYTVYTIHNTPKSITFNLNSFAPDLNGLLGGKKPVGSKWRRCVICRQVFGSTGYPSVYSSTLGMDRIYGLSKYPVSGRISGGGMTLDRDVR